MVGRQLGNYEILEKLGEGGMGEVWRARDTRLGRPVALKVLPLAVAGDPTRRQRLEAEARAVGALNHPNIVAVYDVGEDDGRAYMVSELVEGEPLRAVINRVPEPADFVVGDAPLPPALGNIIHRCLEKKSDIYIVQNLK